VAGRARLSAGVRLAALLVLVLLLHMLALDWLARQLEPISMLRPLATPMFTRLLQPEAPVAVAAPPPKPAAVARRRPSAITAMPSSPKIPKAPVPETAQPLPEAPPPVEEPRVAESTPPSTATTAATTATAEAPAAPASAAIAAPSLDSWPGDTRLNYRLGGNYRGELHGSARVQWQREDNRYQTRVEIDLTLLASLVMTSQGEVTPQGLLPRAYEESRRRGPRLVRMDDDQITLNDGRKVPRPQGVQDTASQFVELSHRFASGQETLEVGRTVSVWVARPGAVDLWIYDIVAREMLQTPELGLVEAFHLKPRPIANPRGNITAEMWFAPSLRYLPVRIRVNMGEDVYVDLMVETIQQR
jgi:hypothetical protein